MFTINETKTLELVVEDKHSAINVGSGDLPVFGTPAMIALMEHASIELVRPHLEEGSTTVGIHLSVDHVRATALGTKVTATAELVAIDGRKLSFKIKAEDEKGIIGEGTLDRFIVYSEKFMAKLG